jgi:hypothetical protein
VAVIAWTASAARAGRIDQMPIDPSRAEEWLAGLATASGLDVLAVITAALWVVLVMRLAIPLWLKGLSATASFLALVIAAVAMSMSNAATAEFRKPRSEVFLDDGSVQTRLLLGSTPDHLATLRIDQGVAVVELVAHPGSMTVVGRQSIASMLQREAGKRE